MTITKAEYHEIHEKSPGPAVPAKPGKARACAECGKPLTGQRRRYCGPDCSAAADRKGAKRRSQKPKAAPILTTPPATKNPPPPSPAARNGAKRDGIATLVAELLAVPDVELELRVGATAVLVRRAAR